MGYRTLLKEHRTLCNFRIILSTVSLTMHIFRGGGDYSMARKHLYKHSYGSQHFASLSK